MSFPSRIRSAITGRFTSQNEADAHPDSTVAELLAGALGSGQTYASKRYRRAREAKLRRNAKQLLESRSGTPPLLDGVPLEGFETVSSEALDRLQDAVEAY